MQLVHYCRLTGSGIDHRVSEIHWTDVRRTSIENAAIKFRDRVKASKHRAQHETNFFLLYFLSRPTAVVQRQPGCTRRKSRRSIQWAQVYSTQIFFSLKRFDLSS